MPVSGPDTARGVWTTGYPIPSVEGPGRSGDRGPAVTINDAGFGPPRQALPQAHRPIPARTGLIGTAVRGDPISPERSRCLHPQPAGLTDDPKDRATRDRPTGHIARSPQHHASQPGAGAGQLGCVSGAERRAWRVRPRRVSAAAVHQMSAPASAAITGASR